MPGPPVSIGCSVLLTPGAAGPPDIGIVTIVSQVTLSVGGMPLVVAGSICTMVNSVSGAPYQLPIGAAGASTGVQVDGQPLVRLGDRIPSGPGVLTILGPPATALVSDGSPP